MPEQIINIYQEVLNRKIEHYNHCSDLYLFVTEEAKNLIENYEHKSNVSKSISETDGKLMYDIPFAYPTYYNKVT